MMVAPLPEHPHGSYECQRRPTMKKTPARKQKLQLQRDTVRELIDQKLTLVVAAGESNQGITGGLDCPSGKP